MLYQSKESSAMCYTGGPRCSNGARKAVSSAKQAVKDDPSEANREALKVAERVFLLTPDGIEQMAKTDPKKAEFFQKKYDESVVEAKKYVKYRDNNKIVLERLDDELTKNTADKQANQKEITKWHKYNNELSMRGDSYDSILRKKCESNISELSNRATEFDKRDALIKGRQETVKASLAENLERRKNINR